MFYLSPSAKLLRDAKFQAQFMGGIVVGLRLASAVGCVVPISYALLDFRRGFLQGQSSGDFLTLSCSTCFLF